MPGWSFLTNHARAILFIAAHPDARLREVADALEVTERTAFGIIADLTEAGYVVKEKTGRRNRYEIQEELPLPESTPQERTVGELVDLLVHFDPPRRNRRAGEVRTTRRKGPKT